MRVYHDDEVDDIVEVLRKDGVISVPTDTVYGVCARCNSEKAQDQLRLVKHRPLTKAFPLMCADLNQIKEICIVDECSEKIINKFMPGPLTVILKKKDSVEDFVNGGMPTLAIRMATSDVLKEIITSLGEPIYMTSANQSGEPTCTSLEEIEKSCPLLDGMLDGEVSFGEASTIVDCSGEELKILRKGPISEEMLKDVIL